MYFEKNVSLRIKNKSLGGIELAYVVMPSLLAQLLTHQLMRLDSELIR